MELAVETYPAWVKSQRKPRAPKLLSDVEKAFRAKQAQQAYDQFKFQSLCRNITNPALNIGL